MSPLRSGGMPPTAVHHVVLFKLVDPSPGIRRQVLDSLGSLVHAKIPGMSNVQVGADVVAAERSYDIAVLAVFDSIAHVETYRTHRLHRQAVDPVEHLFTHVASVDYLVGPE
jgi:Stress responsive A/B Barrel Domain